jgi:peptidoglycan/xylan/chitin deacetylase (PgdA/CDA1 family)
MKRRSFLKVSLAGSLAIGLNGYTRQDKTHIITLSFDDGFKKSFYKIADIHEAYGLMACLNIIATGHYQSSALPASIKSSSRGDFDDWNKLKKRGHEIMPHSWDHSDLTKMPFEQAKEDIIKCLDYFEDNLEGFNASKAVYNFAFNYSTPELEKFTLSRVRAVRTQGDTPVNPIPNSDSPLRLGCWSYGPGNADIWLEKEVNEFLSSPGGWLILNLHGLDEEGWGPVSSEYLNKLLRRLVKAEKLDLLPVAEVLKRLAQ